MSKMRQTSRLAAASHCERGLPALYPNRTPSKILTRARSRGACEVRFPPLWLKPLHTSIGEEYEAKLV